MKLLGSVLAGSTLGRSILAGSTALLLGLGLVSVPPAPARAAGGPATDWMNQGKFGVMMHYLAEGCPELPCTDYPNNMPTVEQWNTRVDNFDVAGVVQQVKSVGAGWLQLSVGQNTGYYAAPNATFDSLVPATAEHPSRLSRRDLIKELGAALHQAGLKFIVYITADPIARDEYARHKLGGDGQNPGAPNATYQANWLNVANTWAQQWGANVDGYFIDGSGYQQLEPFYDQMAAKLRSGNPNALLSFSSGGTPFNSWSAESDFTPGESGVDFWPRPTPDRWVDNHGDQLQLHYLGIAQSEWGSPPDQPLSSTGEERMIDLTRGVVRVGGAVTWDVGYHRDNGHISDIAMGFLTKLGQTLRNIDGNLAVTRTATQSSTSHSASAARAVDGDTNGDFGSGSVTHTADNPLEANPWWQVDLGSSQPVSTIKLWNRTDCCSSRLRDFYVFASDTPFTSNDPNVTKTQSGVWNHHQAEAAGQTLTLPVNRNARYVRVQLAGSDRPLSLAEVQVFGNLALHKPVTQSSTYTSSSVLYSGANAGRANDGNTNGDFLYGSVSHTSETPLDTNPWWQVDLGSSESVSAIKLWNRTDCCSSRLRDFYVFASDTPFTSNDPNVTKTQSGVWNHHQAEAAGQT
ncbi:galactose-binding domain-containing protein, partial [Nonomuraea montanisoli]